MMTLEGRIALVTGAARGIGRGCALALARAGANVAINDREQSDDATSLLNEIRGLGRQAVLVVGDAFEADACEHIVAQSIDVFSHIDILISNPACSRTGDFLDFDVRAFEQVLQGTLLSGFLIGQFVARRMVERRKGGKIVFISSVQARIPYVRCAAYNAAKAGLNHMAMTMAAELARHRINVNVIEPGWIDTPGERALFGEEAIARAAPTLPWGRLGTIDDIGRAAAFLCSHDADYITGASLLVDGGYALRGAMTHAAEETET